MGFLSMFESRLALCASALIFASSCSVMNGQVGVERSASSLSGREQILLLGEVHDNSQGHVQRLEYLKQRSADWGESVTLVFEQFDREQTAELKAASSECLTAKCVVERAGTQGWDWALYEPLIDYGMSRRWSLVAGNLSMSEVRESLKMGVNAAVGQAQVNRFDADKPWPSDWLDRQIASIEAGHCGMLPRDAAEKMVNAQLSRDLWMAQTIVEAWQGGRKVILIAGNGHVNKLNGVPFWLERWKSRLGGDAVKPTIAAVGFVESSNPDMPAGETAPQQFDEIFLFKPAERPDPCEQFKKYMHKKGQPAS